MYKKIFNSIKAKYNYLNKTKRGVESRHPTRNASKFRWKMGKGMS